MKHTVYLTVSIAVEVDDGDFDVLVNNDNIIARESRASELFQDYLNDNPAPAVAIDHD